MEPAHHRKIELQAPEDLTYLIGNVRRAASARVDEAFPPVEGARASDDELRTRIEQLVQEYVTKTFTLASANMSINGMPIDPGMLSSSDPRQAPSSSSAAQDHGDDDDDGRSPEVVYAPFDSRKRARVEELTREQEDLLRDIAALKKSVPAAAAAQWSESAKKAVKADEEALARWKEELLLPEAEGDDAVPEEAEATEKARKRKGKRENSRITVEPLGRQQEVEAAYDEIVRELVKMKREMPAVVAKMERARGAGTYVVGEQ